LGCGEGFSSQNSNTLFFGLGENQEVESITVNWPNGIVTSMSNVAANQSITMFELSCSDPEACNYDPLATGENDEQCTYPGCNDALACNYSAAAGCDDGSCDYACLGCTDPEALNYNPDAQQDDGSCTYLCSGVTLSLLTDCWGEETSWELIDDQNTVVASVQGGVLGNQTTITWNGCLSEGCYDFTIYDSFADGLAGSQSGCDTDGDYYMFLDMTGDTLFSMIEANFGSQTTHSFCISLVPGCTNPVACNYDSEANLDDESCLLPGCLDPLAATYDPLAGCDDGSCLYAALPCAGDFNNDQQIDVADLITFLALFGSNCN
jgi:hypothetical protein